jgi:hypothetical protein
LPPPDNGPATSRNNNWLCSGRGGRWSENICLTFLCFDLFVVFKNRKSITTSNFDS